MYTYIEICSAVQKFVSHRLHVVLQTSPIDTIPGTTYGQVFLEEISHVFLIMDNPFN